MYKIISISERPQDDIEIVTVERNYDMETQIAFIQYLGATTGVKFEKIGDDIYMFLLNVSDMREGPSIKLPQGDMVLFNDHGNLACHTKSTRVFAGWGVSIYEGQQILISCKGHLLTIRGIMPLDRFRVPKNIRIFHHSLIALDARLYGIYESDPNFIFVQKKELYSKLEEWIISQHIPAGTKFFNIEDEENVREKISGLIKRTGDYDVYEYSNPIQFIDDLRHGIIQVNEPDVIVTDNHMPCMTGATLITSIRLGKIQTLDDSWMFIP